jgi:hypothetical protein
MRATRNNAHIATAVLFFLAASAILLGLSMGVLLLLLNRSFGLLLLCIGSFAVACVLATRVMGLLYSRRVSQSLQRDGRRDLDHSYLHGTRMKVSERR